VIQEGSDLLGAQGSGMPLSGEMDKPADPLNVRLFSSVTVVAPPNGGPHLIK
jgi:hypothetical protein